MDLTKHAHACVSLDKNGCRLVIDPGAFTPDAAELVATTDTVLITHEHFDHVDETVIGAALAARPELTVVGPDAAVGRWREEYPGQIVTVADGDRFAAAGFDITVHGSLHAEIHRDIPRCANVGYLVDGSLYHPGDSYRLPPGPVDTLLLPTSGPWTSVRNAADYLRDVGPRQAIQIHEVMLSEIGQRSVARFLSPEMLTEVPLTVLPVGESVTL
ncbi:MBL fold metallo-hydrolase [Myceligenerans indicum]|uniref:MBL fold metallo-hydrolase n=1 Tax=Myceligenerans indicum TaxID=2593663 RepID=A0ABS1LIG3_9MICO|nr:MBL fold metallo-hydrolase [Myceligenerans indicum]MBL0885934.1 MBL fold metallo-hydrolase [Myceligenerans indicum]